MSIQRFLTHLFAPFFAYGFDPELAKDFWWGQDEPWNPEQDVSFRFLKILWMYLASATVQGVLPGILILLIFELKERIQTDEFKFFYGTWIIGAIICALLYVAAAVIATWVYFRIRKHRREKE